MTSQLQVLRQTWQYGERLLSGICHKYEKTLSEALIGQWIKTALNEILPESITRGFLESAVCQTV